MDNSVCVQASSLSDTSNSDINGNRSEATEDNNFHEAVTDLCARSVHSYEASDDQTHDSYGVSGGSDDLGGNMVEDTDSQSLESNAHVEGWHEQVPDNVVGERQWLTSAEIVERIDGSEPNMVGSSQRDTVDEWAHETLQFNVEEHMNEQEVNYVSNEQSEHLAEETLFHGLSDRVDNIEGNRHDDDINWQQSASHLQQWRDEGSENGERDWEQTVVEYTATGWVENTDTNHQESNHFEWTMGNEDRENSHPQEAPEEWQEESGFHEAVQNWLEEEPSDLETPPARQADTFYFPDDDNVNSVELRELLSRYEILLLRVFALSLLTHLDKPFTWIFCS